jgi:hypothetical protein
MWYTRNKKFPTNLLVVCLVVCLPVCLEIGCLSRGLVSPLRSFRNGAAHCRSYDAIVRFV